MYKTDNWWEPTHIAQGLYSVICGDLNGEEIQKRGIRCIYIYIYIYISDSLCYIAKINITS